MKEVILVVGDIYKAEISTELKNRDVNHNIYNNINDLLSNYTNMLSCNIRGIIIIFSNRLSVMEKIGTEINALCKMIKMSAERPRIVLHSNSAGTLSDMENAIDPSLRNYLTVVEASSSLDQDRIKKNIIGALYLADEAYNLSPKTGDIFKSRINRVDKKDTTESTKIYLDLLGEVMNIPSINKSNVNTRIKTLLNEGGSTLPEINNSIDSIINTLSEVGASNQVINLFKAAASNAKAQTLVDLIKELTSSIEDEVVFEPVEVGTLETEIKDYLDIINVKENAMKDTYNRYKGLNNQILTEYNNYCIEATELIKEALTSDESKTALMTSLVTKVKSSILDSKKNSIEVNKIVTQAYNLADTNLKRIYEQAVNITDHYKLVTQKQHFLIDKLKNSKEIILNVNHSLASKLKIIAGVDGCGKTTSALAVALLTKKKKLIIDLDIISPELQVHLPSCNDMLSFINNEDLELLDETYAFVGLKSSYRKLKKTLNINDIEFSDLIIKCLKNIHNDYEEIIIILDDLSSMLENELIKLSGEINFVTNANITNLKRLTRIHSRSLNSEEIVIKKIIVTQLQTSFPPVENILSIIGNHHCKVIEVPIMPVDIYKSEGKIIFKERDMLLSSYRTVK